MPCAFTPAFVCSRIWQSGIESTVRFYQASTSELYGKIQVVF
jgi:GDP-D-mannose dehydratase